MDFGYWTQHMFSKPSKVDVLSLISSFNTLIVNDIHGQVLNA